MLSVGLRNCMKFRNMSTAKLSRVTGVHSNIIWRIREGMVDNPSYSTLVRLADGLGVDLDVLCGRSTIYSSRKRGM